MQALVRQFDCGNEDRQPDEGRNRSAAKTGSVKPNGRVNGHAVEHDYAHAGAIH
jgi:hypothetical protein